MPEKAHWSSLRRRVALSDHPSPPSHSQNLPQGVDDFGRRLTLGDVGDWFRNKLPSHRPERGGTLRNNGAWEKEEADDGISSTRLQDKANNRVPGKQPSASNRRGGRHSRTGGSDRLVDWNTPKNLSEAVPETETAPRSKVNAGQKPLTTRCRWNDFGSLRIGKKRDGQNPSASIEVEKDRGKEPMRRSSRAKSFAAVIQGTSSILEVLEANRKARRRAREDRESLRESGDYLGVQGINPQTGVLDLTSDSGESALSSETEQKLLNLEDQAKSASSAAERKEAEIEIVKIHLDHEVAKVRRLQKEEKQLAASVTGKWRRGTHQWSSVQEPGLSPIAQSHRSTSGVERDAPSAGERRSPRDQRTIGGPRRPNQHFEIFFREGPSGRNRTWRTPDISDFSQERLPIRPLVDSKHHRVQSRRQLTSEEQGRDTKPGGEHPPRKLRARFDDQPREIHYPPDNIGTNRVRFPRKPVPTHSSLDIPSASPGRTCVEPASNRKLKDTAKSGTRGTEQFNTVTNSPTAPATNIESWDHKRPPTPKRGRAVSNSRSPHRSSISHERSDFQTGPGNSAHNNQGNNTNQRTGSQRDFSRILAPTPGETRDQSSYRQPDNIEIHPKERPSGQTGPTAQAQAQPGHPQPEEIWHNAKQLGSFPSESWAEYIAEIGVGGGDSSNRYYIRETSGEVEKTTTGARVQHHGETARGASSAAPMQQFVDIHLFNGCQKHRKGAEKAEDSLQRQFSIEQHRPSIPNRDARSQQSSNGSGDARTGESSKASERRRRHRRSFQ
ncbi:hypothetical protein IL306_004186 [Fusarium sp. DS 682]|nr:hypothetical protein IL306_004186 [Fusarium sp. DS 682]